LENLRILAEKEELKFKRDRIRDGISDIYD